MRSSLSGAQGAPGRKACDAEQDRPDQVQQRVPQRPAVLAALEQHHGFAGEGGKGRQATEKARDRKQPPFGRQMRMRGEETERQPDQASARRLLSAQLAELYRGRGPVPLAHEMLGLIDLVADTLVARSKEPSQQRWMHLAQTALRGITATLDEACKAAYAATLFAESPRPMREAHVQLFRHAFAALAPSASGASGTGESKNKSFDHGLRRLLFDTPCRDSVDYMLRADAWLGYVGELADADKILQGIAILTEPLSARISPFDGYFFRDRAFRVLELTVDEPFLQGLDATACADSGAQRSAALLLRSPAYTLPSPATGFSSGLIAEFQERVRVCFFSLLVPLTAPLDANTLQAREARLIALSHQMERVSDDDGASLRHLAGRVAALPLPAPGHPCREQTVALRGRALAQLMLTNLRRPHASCLEARLPTDAAARRDDLEVRRTAWSGMSHLTVASDVWSLWKGELGYMPTFPRVPDDDRPVLREAMFTSLWAHDPEHCSDALAFEVEKMTRAEVLHVRQRHCDQLLEIGALTVMTPALLLRTTELMLGVFRDADGSYIPAGVRPGMERYWTAQYEDDLVDAGSEGAERRGIEKAGAEKPAAEQQVDKIIGLLQRVGPRLTPEIFCLCRDALMAIEPPRPSARAAAGVADSKGHVGAIHGATKSHAELDDELSGAGSPQVTLKRALWLLDLLAAVYAQEGQAVPEALTAPGFFKAQHACFDQHPRLSTLEEEMVRKVVVQFQQSHRNPG